MSAVDALGTECVIELPQGPIRVYDRGEGEPIVFLHGLFANALAWRKVVPLLAGAHRCVCVDWPFGSHHIPMSPDADLTPQGIAATVADVINALGLDRVTLVGNDGGGMLSQLVVTDRPERVGRLVLTPCDAFENFPPAMFKYLCWLPRLPGGMTLLGQSLRSGIVRRMPNGYGWLSHTRVEREILDSYTAPLRNRQIRRDAAKFLRAVDNRCTLDAATRFASFTKPVLVAWASDDRFFPLEHAHRLTRAFPDARLEIISDSRTYVAEDQPERTAQLIADFIATTPTGQPRQSTRMKGTR